MNLKEILAQVGVKVTEEQIENLSQLVEVKKQKKGSKKWIFVKDEFSAKTPLQMRQAVLAIKEAGEVTNEQWSEKLAAYEGFRTQQPVDRIVAFYKKRMLTEGLVKEV